MLRRMRQLVAGLSTAAGLIVMPVAAQSAENWTMATAWGGGPFLEYFAKGYASEVEFLTDGEIKMTVYAGGAIGKPLKVTDTVKSGVAQIGHNAGFYDWGIDKASVLFANMAGGLTPEELAIWMYEAGAADMLMEYRKEVFGVISIPCGVWPTEVFLHSKRPIRSAEDMKGLKMRTAGAWAEIAGDLGAATVSLPGAEVYPALERGVIDATEWSSPAINLPAGFHKIAKYIMMPGVHQPAALAECMINMDAWNKLSDRNKELLKRAGKVLMLDTWAHWTYEDLSAIREFEKSGNEVIVLDREFIATANKAADAWADKQAVENAWFKRVLEHRRAFQANMADFPKIRFSVGVR